MDQTSFIVAMLLTVIILLIRMEMNARHKLKEAVRQK